MRKYLFPGLWLVLSVALLRCNGSANSTASNQTTDLDTVLTLNDLKRTVVVVDDMPPRPAPDSLPGNGDTAARFAAQSTAETFVTMDNIILVNGKGSISGRINQDSTGRYSIVGTDGITYPLAFPNKMDTLKTSQMKIFYALPVRIGEEASQLLLPEAQLQRLLKKE